MTARDAIDRLNRSRSQKRGELPDRAPLDHLRQGGLEPITIPPDGKPIMVCQAWPGCGCSDNCIDLRGEADISRWIAAGMMIAVAVIGAGLLYVGVR